MNKRYSFVLAFIFGMFLTSSVSAEYCRYEKASYGWSGGNGNFNSTSTANGSLDMGAGLNLMYNCYSDSNYRTQVSTLQYSYALGRNNYDIKITGDGTKSSDITIESKNGNKSFTFDTAPIQLTWNFDYTDGYKCTGTTSYVSTSGSISKYKNLNGEVAGYSIRKENSDGSSIYIYADADGKIGYVTGIQNSSNKGSFYYYATGTMDPQSGKVKYNYWDTNGLLYNSNGEVIGYKYPKRIYTVEEAVAVTSSNGNLNTFTVKYR